MIESGVINKIENNIARVTVAKGEQCKECTACSAFGEGSAELVAKVDLPVKIGDRVEVEIEPQKVIRHSAIVFLLPVFSLVIGYFVGVKYLIRIGIGDEGAGIIGSLGLMVLTFIAIAFYDRLFIKSKEINAHVVRIL